MNSIPHNKLLIPVIFVVVMCTLAFWMSTRRHAAAEALETAKSGFQLKQTLRHKLIDDIQTARQADPYGIAYNQTVVTLQQLAAQKHNLEETLKSQQESTPDLQPQIESARKKSEDLQEKINQQLIELEKRQNIHNQ